MNFSDSNDDLERDLIGSGNAQKRRTDKEDADLVIPNKGIHLNESIDSQEFTPNFFDKKDDKKEDKNKNIIIDPIDIGLGRRVIYFK